MKKRCLDLCFLGIQLQRRKRLDLPQKIQKISSTLWQTGQLISGCKNGAARIPAFLRHSWADPGRTAVSNDLSNQGGLSGAASDKVPDQNQSAAIIMIKLLKKYLLNPIVNSARPVLCEHVLDRALLEKWTVKKTHEPFIV